MLKNSNGMKGLEQGRAEVAFNSADNFYSEKGYDKEYKQYVKKLPMMIKTNGLGATLAFMISKKKKKEWKYYEAIGNNITDWICEHRSYLLGKVSINKDNNERFKVFISELIKMNSPEYRALTVEVLAFLGWLKRFAEGLFEGKEGEGVNGTE